MRRLVLLALAVLATFPLSADGHWRRPRRVVVVEEPCRPRDSYSYWHSERPEYRHYGWHHRRHYRPYCDDDPIVYRPLPPPPFRGRVELWVR